jgi:hypothetical protein
MTPHQRALFALWLARMRHTVNQVLLHLEITKHQIDTRPKK